MLNIFLLSLFTLSTANFPPPQRGLFTNYANHRCVRDCRGAQSMECEYTFNIEWVYTMEREACKNCSDISNNCPRCIVADRRSRIAIAYNQQIPGPAIHVCQGDRVIVNLWNYLNDAGTSIHWHGLHQRKSQWMDGVPWVTQCEIPANLFQYDFLAEEEGTHFYHSHSGVQRADGAFGALVVRPRTNINNIYANDRPEHVIMLSDWFYKLSHDHLQEDIRFRNFTEDVIATLLINGVGTTDDNRVPPKIFTVDPGTSYRFRVVNAASKSCPMELSIEQHDLIIISSDGNDIEPITVNSLVIANGERYDFVINTKNNPRSFLIRVVGSIHCINRASYAILQYRGGRSTNMESLRQSYVPPPRNAVMNCVNEVGSHCRTYNQMRSLKVDRRLTRAVEYRYYIGADIRNFETSNLRIDGTSDAYVGQINTIVYNKPYYPLLLNPRINQDTCNYEKVVNNRTGCTGEYCECTHMIEIALGTLVEFIFVDEGTLTDISHPIHLHGYNFAVMDQGKLGSTVSVAEVRRIHENRRTPLVYDRQPLKDSVSVHDGGYTVVRFIADNPGYWFMHCHVDFHVEVGMTMVVKVGDPSTIKVPADFPNNCGPYVSKKMPQAPETYSWWG